MISVIVPYYNSADVLERCLRSLTSQAGDFEFLIINDISTDGAEEIAQHYAAQDERFRLFDTEYKFGVSGARNTGLDHARGDWITFLDADDEMQPDSFKTFRQAIKKHPGYKIYQFDHYRHYAKSGRTRIKDPNIPGVYSSGNLPRRWREVWNKIYSADLAKMARFNLNLMVGEDELYNIECLAIEGRIRCVKGITVMHHYDGRPTLSRTKTDTDALKLVRAMMDFIEDHKDPEARGIVCRSMTELWPRYLMNIFTREE